MLLPALSKAREKARAIQCVNNMKQTGLTLQMYSTDNEDVFPIIHGGSFDAPTELAGEPQWFDVLVDDYNYQLSYLKCGSDTGYNKDDGIQSYMINAMFTFGRPMIAVQTSQRIVLSERGYEEDGVTPEEHQCYPGMGSYTTYQGKLDLSRHSDKANYLFADGHVETALFAATIGDGTAKNNMHFVSEWLNDYVAVSSHP